MRPTTHQIYALAAALCERMGEAFPETREAASATIERLRAENGHPVVWPEETPPRRARSRRRNRGPSDVAARLADEID